MPSMAIRTRLRLLLPGTITTRRKLAAEAVLD